MNWQLSLFGSLPFIGKRVKLTHYKNTLTRIDFIASQFGKPMVSFDANIHDLYDCLRNSPVVLDNDFDWFTTLGISAFTKTSGEASEFLYKVHSGEMFKYDPYFKQLDVSSLETDFMEWYTNYDTTQGFIENYMYTLQQYCDENPRDVELGAVYRDILRPQIHKSEIAFFNSREFRLVLDDFLTMVRMSLHSQMRRLNGDAT